MRFFDEKDFIWWKIIQSSSNKRLKTHIAPSSSSHKVLITIRISTFQPLIKINWNFSGLFLCFFWPIGERAACLWLNQDYFMETIEKKLEEIEDFPFGTFEIKL